MIIVGIILEICAAALGTVSKQLIAYSEHVKKRWIFHIGATINIAVGPIVDASAYAFAPQIVIAPFACLDVIFNALTAPYTLSFQQETLTKAHVLGTALVATGAIFTAVFGSVIDEVLDVYQLERQLTQPASIAYMVIELSAILTINFMLKKKMMSARVRGISLGVIAGVLMGNVFCMKGVLGLLRLSIEGKDSTCWFRPTPYILIVAAAGGAVVGHIFMRKGLGEYKGIFMVTIFEGAHITAACLSGCVVMEEMAHAPWWRYLCYWCSVALIIAGMVIINTAASNSQIGGASKNKQTFHIAQSFVDENGQRIPGEDGGTIGRGADTYPQPETGIDFVQPLREDGNATPLASRAALELESCSLIEDGWTQASTKVAAHDRFSIEPQKELDPGDPECGAMSADNPQEDGDPEDNWL